MPKWWFQFKQHVTLKGILKLISTLHVCIGVMFWYFLLTLLDRVNHQSNITSHTAASLMGVQYFIYLFLFLPFGIFIHRGINKESVPTLQWSGSFFLILQIYGSILQYHYEFIMSNFVATTFDVNPSRKFHTSNITEIIVGLSITLIYMTLINFYVRQLKSHFYIPPIYPCRVEYFYYPEDTSSNITVFHKQVPCQIMHNYQNSAYFVQKDYHKSSCSSSTSGLRGAGPGRTLHSNNRSPPKGGNSLLVNGKISLQSCNPWGRID